MVLRARRCIAPFGASTSKSKFLDPSALSLQPETLEVPTLKPRPKPLKP